MPGCARLRHASMGPSMIVDGDITARCLRAAGGSASMGPSMIVDGDTELIIGKPNYNQASMGPSMIVDGDSPGARSPVTPPRSGFNGAVDDRRRRQGVRQLGAALQIVLQWGRR